MLRLSAVPEDNAVATTPMPRKTRIEGGLYYLITRMGAHVRYLGRRAPPQIGPVGS